MKEIELCFMEDKELRAILAANIKKYRNRRGWSQLILAEKLNISANYLSAVETGKGWVTSLTLAKLANVLDIEVHELFLPVIPVIFTQYDAETEKMKCFARDMALALDVSTSEVINSFKMTIDKVCKEYLDHL